MVEFVTGLLNLGLTKPLGSAAKQPQLVPPQANKVAVQFSHRDLEQMVINKLYNEATWLREYKRGALIVNPDRSFTVEFYK